MFNALDFFVLRLKPRARHSQIPLLRGWLFVSRCRPPQLLTTRCDKSSICVLSQQSRPPQSLATMIDSPRHESVRSNSVSPTDRPRVGKITDKLILDKDQDQGLHFDLRSDQGQTNYMIFLPYEKIRSRSDQDQIRPQKVI